MPDAVAPAGTSPGDTPRERGWKHLLLALAAFLLVPATPLLHTFLPIERTLLLLVPAVAACALAGWWAGGRLWLALVWTALAAVVLAAPQPVTSTTFDLLSRGWALLLAAAFGFVCLMGAPHRFLGRALTAFAIALALGIVTLGVVRGSPARVQRVVGAELTKRGAADLARFQENLAQPESRKWLAADAGRDSVMTAVSSEMAAIPELSTAVYPALLGLESLVALALAWALFHRLSRVRLGPPLGALREFRFNDQLVWGLIAGLTMVMVPSLAALRGVGANLLVFFGALYVMRGAGVAAWFMAPGWTTTLALTVCAIVFGPLLAVGALGLGLGDTWLDWRTRRARPTT